MAYQTIGQKKGGSDSEGKLTRLHLPELSGKSFLDLGCNMGFFCREARRRGARRTVGVDRIHKNILEAQQLDTEGEYIEGDWMDILRNSQEYFDVIIHLSAFHYVADQWEFLNLVQERLAPGGVFILECGIIDSEIPRYHYIRRREFVRHITDALFQKLVSPFEVSKVGQSVYQQGDPVPRFVYHCHKRQSPPSRDSRPPKAVLSQRELEITSEYVAGEQAILPMKELIPSLTHCPNPPVAYFLQQFFDAGNNQAGLAEAIVDAGLVSELSSSIANLIPNCFTHVAMPGAVFTDRRICQEVTNQLIARGFDCYDNDRQLAWTEEVRTSVINLLHPHEDITFHGQAAAKKFLRRKPVDEEIRMIVGNKPPTAAAWSFPSAPNRQFECYLRIHRRARPVKFIFDVLDKAKVSPDDKIFEFEHSELTVTKVVKRSERHTRVIFDLPATTGNTIVRLSIKMARLLDAAMSPKTFVGSPRLIW